MGGQVPFHRRSTLILQTRSCGLGSSGVAELVLGECELLESQGRVRISGELVGSVGEVALGEERIATSGFVVVLDDEVAGNRGVAFELGNGFLSDVGMAAEGSDARLFTEDRGEGKIAVWLTHPRERLLDGGFQCAQLFELTGRVRGKLRAAEADFEL